MANTIGTPTYSSARAQFQGLFSEMWTVKASITDTDAILATDTLLLSLTVPGVALGDMVVGISVSADLSDGTDQIVLSASVSAANTVSVQLTADVGAFDADALNAAVVRILIGRPTW